MHGEQAAKQQGLKTRCMPVHCHGASRATSEGMTRTISQVALQRNKRR